MASCDCTVSDERHHFCSTVDHTFTKRKVLTVAGSIIHPLPELYCFLIPDAIGNLVAWKTGHGSTINNITIINSSKVTKTTSKMSLINDIRIDHNILCEATSACSCVGLVTAAKQFIKPVCTFGLIIQQQKPKGSSYAPNKKISLPHPELREGWSRPVPGSTPGTGFPEM